MIFTKKNQMDLQTMISYTHWADDGTVVKVWANSTDEARKLIEKARGTEITQSQVDMIIGDEAISKYVPQKPNEFKKVNPKDHPLI